jgi:hypothetical protein
MRWPAGRTASKDSDSTNPYPPTAPLGTPVVTCVTAHTPSG